MKNTTQLGSLGESKVITKLIELGFNVFVPAFDRNERFDLIASKDNLLYKISVKTTSRGKYNGYDVGLRSCRSNTKGTKIRHFDVSDCDIVAVYILPLDVVCFIKSIELVPKSTFRIRSNLSNHYNGRRQWVVTDYLDFPS